MANCKTSLVRTIREYSEGEIVREDQFYINTNLKSSIRYNKGQKVLLISYNEEGEQVGKMQYNGWKPINGVEITKNRKSVYKDSVLVEEINYYFNTNQIFSKKTPTKEIFLDTLGTTLGFLDYKVQNGFSRPTNGVLCSRRSRRNSKYREVQRW